ncbi:MAG: hypothetical protein AAB511_02650 [Patescibacteria group bacterium]
MPKNILQDVVPRNGRRSIRDIPVSRQGQKTQSTNSYNRQDLENNSEPVREIEYSRTEQETLTWKGDAVNNTSRWVIWTIGIVSSGFLVMVLGNIFSGATVTVTPKSQIVAIDREFTAKPNAPLGSFSYTPYSLVSEKEVSIPADGEKSVETRGSGKIIIYNNYSATSQRLVKNTRFETPDGLIYKISDSVTVPGRQVLDGKLVPGSIEVLVIAESAGSEYNIGLTDFKIPGFKSNAERFIAFYAKSKTIMSGGKIGTEKVVSEQKTIEARNKLDVALTESLLAEARTHVPADSILYEGAYRVSYEPVVVSTNAGQNNIIIRERARLNAYFIKHTDIAKVVAQSVITDFDGSDVLVPNDNKLVFILRKKDGESATTVGPIQFNLKGAATIVWQIDKDKLASNLAGKDKDELSSIAGSDSAVLRATAVIRPFWKGVFPKSTKDIKVKVESGK